MQYVKITVTQCSQVKVRWLHHRSRGVRVTAIFIYTRAQATGKTQVKEELIMIYSFLYDFAKYSPEERRNRLKELTDAQLEVLEHAYFSKFSAEWLRGYAQDFDPTSTTGTVKGMLHLIRLIRDNPATDELAADILTYFYVVSTAFGGLEARKAAKVLFCKRRIVGVKSRDVIAEINARKEKLKKV